VTTFFSEKRRRANREACGRSLSASCRRTYCAGTTARANSFTSYPVITAWGDAPMGCSVMWQAESPWAGHSDIWNQDLPGFFRGPEDKTTTTSCDYYHALDAGFSPYWAQVCFKPEPLKATLTDQFAKTKTHEWHLAAPGQNRCPNSRTPTFYECAEAAKNIMTKYYPDDDADDSMQWMDTDRVTRLDMWCGRAGWGSTPIGCSMHTRQNRGKGPWTAYYMEEGIRKPTAEWKPLEDKDHCLHRVIDPDLQLICEGIEPMKTPDMKDMDETEEMYKNYCEVVTSDIGRGLSPLNPGKGWCGTVPLARSDLAENDLKDWVHQSECLSHRKCIAGFGDLWSTDNHMNCVDTVSPCHWNPINPRALRCLTGLSYAQRSAQTSDPITRTFEKVAENQALMHTLVKSRIAWYDRMWVSNLENSETIEDESLKIGFKNKIYQGSLQNLDPYDTEPQRSDAVYDKVTGDGRSGSLSARGMRKEYTTHFEHCGGKLFRRRF